MYSSSSVLTASLLVILLILSLQGTLFPMTQTSSLSSTMKISKLAGSTISEPVSEIQVPQQNSLPLAINTDSNGNVWFAESSTQQIVEYIQSNGTFRNFLIPTPKNNLSLIWFIVFDNFGNIWFSSAQQPLIWRLFPSTGQFANFSTGSQLVDPYALAYDSSSNEIWFTSTYTGQIGDFQIYSNGSASLLNLISIPTPESTFQNQQNGQLIGASGLSLDGHGNLFVGEAFADAIAEYNFASSTFIRVWKLSPGSEPVGVAADWARGRIWFTNHATSFFGYLAISTGQEVEFSTSLFSFVSGGYGTTISLPYWIQVAPSGVIWFNEHYGNKIARFDPKSLQLTEFLVPTESSSPLRFTLDNSRSLVWFTEFEGNKIGMLPQNASALASGIPSTNSQLFSGSYFSLTVNYISLGGIDENFFSPLVSGTISISGDLSSNLTMSSQSLNATAYRLTFSRGQELASGNYTVTICSRLSNTDNASSPSPVRECSIVFLTVENETFFGLDQIEVYVLAIIVILVTVAISLIYVRKWRSA